MQDESKSIDSGSDEPSASGTSRRAFLQRLGAASMVAATVPLTPAWAQTSPAATSTPAPAPREGLVPVKLKINGKPHSLQVDPRQTLLDCLREDLHLTGTKKGCDHGQCGACTLHVNGQRVNSCLCLVALHDGDEVTTIEGLGQPGNLHPMQAAFLACDGYQCGYCTSGQIMSGAALMKEPCGQSDADVKEMMSGNICRCGAYANIVEAIQSVRQPA